MFIALLFMFSTVVHAESIDGTDSLAMNESIQIESVTAETSHCMKSYQVLRNRMAVVSGLAPFVGGAEIFGSAMLAVGYEYGGMTTLRASALAPAAGVFFNSVLPSAALLSYLGLETFSIIKFVQANRAYHLLKDLYGIGDGKMLSSFIRSVQKSRPDLSEEEIKNQLITADQNEELCNGNWANNNHQKHHLLVRNLVMIGKMKKHIIHSENVAENLD